MEVTILGCSGGYPGPGQAASGYLLTINDKKVLIDCGSGVFSNLQLHVPLNGLDAILISHLHADHYSDLMVMRYAIDMNTKHGMEFKNVPIFAPKTPEGVIHSLTNDWGYKIGYIGHESELPLFGAKARFFRTNHPVECYGIRVEHEGKVFVYTADASVDSLFAGYLDDADLAIMDGTEVTYTVNGEVVSVKATMIIDQLKGETDLSDYLFKQILHRNDTKCPSVIIRDNSNMQLLMLEIRKQC